MFRIAKNLVKTLEQSVQETLSLSGDTGQLDAFFQSIPPNLLLPQSYSHLEQDQDQAQKPVQQQHRHRFNEVVSGLRVVFVDETQLQLESYFDYIVGINDDAVPMISNQHGYFYPDYNRITQLLNASANNTLKLNVWSAKGGTFRDEYISVLSKDETKLEDVSLSSGSMKESERAFQTLGFKVQWSPLIAATFTYHVLNINSYAGPAAQSTLIPDEDYIIGCQDGLLATGGETLLQDIVRSRANHDLQLYVYNMVHDCVRPITVHIGGDGRLGCNVGYGFLHRIPTVIKATQDVDQEPSLTPSAPVTDLEPASSSTFLPSALAPPVGPKKSTTTSKKKHTTVPAQEGPMSEYFNEGKDQSARPTSSSHLPEGESSIAPPPVSSKKSTDT